MVFLTGILLTCCRYCFSIFAGPFLFSSITLRVVRGSKLFSRLQEGLHRPCTSSEVTGPFFSVSLEYRMKVGMSEMVECGLRYSTCLLRPGVDLSECFSVIFKSSEVLLGSDAQLMKKEMELYELRVVFIFKGVWGWEVCVCTISLCFCLHLVVFHPKQCMHLH